MFNLSNDFIIKKEVNKSIKEEFRLKFKNKNISFIDSFNLKELMNLLNNSDIKKKDIVLIIKYLCFLNDKEVILFPLFFDKYPKINTSYCLNIMNEGIPKNYIDEHKIIHKNDNFRFGQIFRSYDGNIDFLSKEEYEKVIKEMEKLGFSKGWIQDIDSASVYQPDFNKKQPFEINK